MRVYQCADSLEGIFTAIYNIYEEKCHRQDAMIDLTGELFLFAEYVSVKSDDAKALKVINTLRRRFGEENYKQLCMALSSPDPEKAQAVFRTVEAGLGSAEGAAAGLKGVRPGHLFDNLADPFVHKAFSLARGANREYLHLEGFVRFSELKNGILYSRIGPKNNLLAFLMPHFADRFPMENFVLCDEGRGLFGVHSAGKDWYLVRGEELRAVHQSGVSNSGLDVSEEEIIYQKLFRHFCREIAIEERRNLELQRNMLPFRFREYMVECD